VHRKAFYLANYVNLRKTRTRLDNLIIVDDRVLGLTTRREVVIGKLTPDIIERENDSPARREQLPSALWRAQARALAGHPDDQEPVGIEKTLPVAGILASNRTPYREPQSASTACAADNGSR